MTEAQMLREHGTVVVRLNINNIVQAAYADLRLSVRKQQNRLPDDKPYSFARQHVRRARSVGHLIALAYFEPWVAERTDKNSTLIVYGDRALLCSTLIAVLDGSVEVPELPELADGSSDAATIV